jgi:hypothetical protein
MTGLANDRGIIPTMKRDTSMPTLQKELQEKMAAATLEKSPAKKPTKAAELTKAASEAKEKAHQIYTPSQVIGVFADNFDKQTSTKLKSLYDDLLSEFSSEANSRIEIGSTLLKIRLLIGDTFGKFLSTCVVETLRKSVVTCYNYIALSEVFSLKFAKNKVFRDALARIWGAEGCFDPVNGELKPAVDQAIKAIGGIPESPDSGVCEVAARKFVVAVDLLVKGSRQAQPGGRTWDAETITKKHENVVKGFTAFIMNKSVSSMRAQKLFQELVTIAMVEMAPSNVRAAWDSALKQISEKKMEVKKAHEDVQQTVAEASA